jgi:hypothetical protein
MHYHDELINRVTVRFKIPALNTEVEHQDGSLETFEIQSYWLARMYNSLWKWSGRNLNAAVIKSNRWTKGLLMLPDMEDEGSLPLSQPVELVSWHDPVEEALHHIDLMVRADPPHLGDGHHFSIIACGGGSYTEFLQLIGAERNETHEKLWDALGKTTSYLADLAYPEIRKVFLHEE